MRQKAKQKTSDDRCEKTQENLLIVRADRVSGRREEKVRWQPRSCNGPKMSGSRRSAKAGDDEGKQLAGRPTRGSDVGYRLHDLRDNVDDTRSGEQGNRWYDRVSCCRCRRGRCSIHYHRAVASGFAEGRFRRAANYLERLPITTVRRRNAAAGSKRRAALSPFAVPSTRRFGGQHSKKQRECNNSLDEASFQHGRSIPRETSAVKILRCR